MKPWTVDGVKPHILELSGFISVSLRAPREEGGMQQLPSTITRRGDSNHKYTVPGRRAELRELQDAIQSPIHSHPTWLPGPEESWIAF